VNALDMARRTDPDSNGETTQEAQRPGRRRSRRVRVMALGAAMGLVVALGAQVVLRESPGEKSIGEVMESYGKDRDQAAPALAHAPPAGVYRAEGAGRRGISMPPLSQNDGATIPVVVEHLDAACWRLTVNYNDWQWESFDYCLRDGVSLNVAGKAHQRWDAGFITFETTQDINCEPGVVADDPQAAVGTVWSHTCRASGEASTGTSTSSGEYTLVAIEPVTVGSESVMTRHYRSERMWVGGQDGPGSYEAWFAADTGMPLRMTRTVALDSASPIGTVTYTDEGWWNLTSRAPAV
jgi:hypothetical protein